MKWNSKSRILKETKDARVPLGFLDPDSAELTSSVRRKQRGYFSSPSNQSSALIDNPGETQRQSSKRFVEKRMLRELRVLQLQIAMIADDDGDRPIHVAVANEDLKLVKKLCFLMKKAAISLDITNYLRQTPLHLAVMIGNVVIVKFLLRNGATLLLRDRHGNSVIHLAVKSNANKDVFSEILSHPQAKNILNIMDHEGYSALHYAVFKGDSIAVYFLSSYGADINVFDGKSGRTSLIHAVLSESLEMIKILLKYGACVLKADYSGRSALDLALLLGKNTIIKLIEDANHSKEVVLSDNLYGLSEKEDSMPLKAAEMQKSSIEQNSTLSFANNSKGNELSLEETCLCMIKTVT